MIFIFYLEHSLFLALVCWCLNENFLLLVGTQNPSGNQLSIQMQTGPSINIYKYSLTHKLTCKPVCKPSLILHWIYIYTVAIQRNHEQIKFSMQFQHLPKDLKRQNVMIWKFRFFLKGKNILLVILNKMAFLVFFLKIFFKIKFFILFPISQRFNWSFSPYQE